MTGNKVLNIIRQKCSYILPQDANLLLYGSRARGNARPDSDWDFIILLNSDNISDNDYSKYAYPLQEIGFDHRSRSERSFEKGYQELLKYKEKFGNYDVPVLYTTDSGFKLGDWLYRKRVDNQLGKLSKERYNALTEIGVDLTITDDWDEKMKLVEAYYAEHGNADIPAGYVVEGIWLNSWYAKQRRIVLGQQKGSLSNQ